MDPKCIEELLYIQMFFYSFLLCHAIISCGAVQFLDNCCVHNVADRNKKPRVIIIFLSYKLKNYAEQVCWRKDIKINTVIDMPCQRKSRIAFIK